MGLFDFLKKKEPKVTVEISTHEYTPKELQQQQENEVREIKELARKSIPSINGLRPHEIFMLSYAPYYKTEGNSFPKFWHYDFGVDDPQALLDMLLEHGFIRIATAKESIEKLKIAELKEILSEHGIKATGKKADLVLSVQENISEEDLSQKIPVRRYALTELGEQELKENEYVTYFGGSNKYGMTVWDMNLLIQNYPHKLFRDKIWAHLNQRLHESAIEFQKSGDMYSNYLKETAIHYEMSSFLIEENKHLEDALKLWAEAVYYDIMISAVESYKMSLDIKKRIPYTNISGFKEIIDLPYKVKSIRSIRERLNFSDDELFQKLISYFLEFPQIRYDLIKRYNITKLNFPIQDIAGLIVAELNENADVANKVYEDIERQIKNDKTPILGF